MFRVSAARPVRVLALLAFVLGATRLALAVPAATLPPPQAQAAGAPILSSCGSMQNAVDRLKVGLPLQNEWIKRSEDQLRAADEGVRGSQDELKGMALKAGLDLVKNQLQLISDMKGIARAAKSAEARNKLLDRIKLIENATEKIEQAEKLGKAGIEGNQFGSAVAQNRAQLVDFIKFVNESGICDELGLKAAELAGPVGVAVVQTFTVARDVVYASFQGKMSADEAAVHRQNLEAMRSAKADVETRIYEMSTELAKPPCTPTPRPADRIAVEKEPEPTSGSGGRTTPRSPATTSQKKPSGARVMGTILVAGAAGIGGYYYLDKALKAVEGTATGGGTSGGSVKATLVSMSAITCTFNAGGIISSCTGSITFDITGSLPVGTGLRFQFDGGPGGNRTSTSNPAGNVTFTISGGTSTSTCPSLRSGVVLKTSTQEAIGSFSSLPTSVTCR